jgi:hypothetical protein
MSQEQKNRSSSSSSSSWVTKRSIIDIFETDGIRYLDEAMRNPGARVDALQRTKRLFESACLHMDDIFDALIERGCIAQYPLLLR